jgi:hypothetical protein
VRALPDDVRSEDGPPSSRSKAAYLRTAHAVQNVRENVRRQIFHEGR